MARVTGLNHVTLAVSDLERSVAFYRDRLGGRLAARWPKGAYLEMGALWLCLDLHDEMRARADDTHLAFTADDYDALAGALADLPRWKENVSEGASLYLLDPDGHKLEIHAGDLASRLAHYRAHPEKGVTIF